MKTIFRKKTPQNFRFDALTVEQLQKLAEDMKVTKTRILELAIQRLYEDELR